MTVAQRLGDTVSVPPSSSSPSPSEPAGALVAILLPRESPWLYASQLGTWYAGGAFTCLDPQFPDGHLTAVLADASPAAVITNSNGAARLADLGILLDQVIVLGEGDDPPEPKLGSGRYPAITKSRSADALAYVIYTSGTTGQPKGVMIEHRSILNLVEADIETFGLGPANRVAQVSSPAYDSSIEEAWLAFAAGATLVVLDDETVRLGPDLVPWLRRERISVLCPPPTLLRTTGCLSPATELPELTLLYVGGEALPQDIADRWAPGRWLENGYGPTECTVTVVRGRVEAGRPVTIGRPLRGHRAWVVDESLAEVPDGEEGELIIAGPGLARGYYRRPDLTAERFVDHAAHGRIYRTGDVVRRNEQGDLEYCGRLDDQVKLRGYRIELGAVEASLARQPGVRAAACAVQGRGVRQILAAFVVPEDPATPLDLEALRTALRHELPEYMVPAHIALLGALPTSVGGKLDRRALPESFTPPASARRGEPESSTGEVESAFTAPIKAAFAQAFAIEADAVAPDDDFFLDLGGDSITAVAVVVALRQQEDHPELTNVAVRDVYEARTAAALARRIASRQPDLAWSGDPLGRHEIPPLDPQCRPLSPAALTLAQTGWLGLELMVISAVTYFAVFQVLPRLVAALGVQGAIVAAPFLAIVSMLVYLPLSVGATVLAKQVFIGRYQPIRVSVWSVYYLRHWLVTHTASHIPWSFVEGTVYYGAVLRALGARVGRNVHVHRGVELRSGGWDLLTLGDEVSLGQESAPRLVTIEAGHLVIGPITIGDDATLEVRAGLSPDTVVASGGYLTALSWLPSGQCIPAGERWDGVPAVRAGAAPARSALTPNGGARGSRELSPLAHGALVIGAQCGRQVAEVLPLAVALVVLLTLHPEAGARLMAWIESPTIVWSDRTNWIFWLILPSVGLPVGLALQAWALRAMGAVKPGVYHRWGLDYLRVWIKSGVVDGAGNWLSGSLFWPMWLRLAGMRIGRGCEISTVIDVVPETVEIGADSFFADGIYFCSPRVHRGTVTLEATRLGRNTFLGNHAVVMAGQTYADDLFVGVATVLGQAETAAVPVTALGHTGGAWFGHPPMQLPRREVVAADRRLTHDPGPARYWTRVFWELLRFGLPVLPLALVLGWYAAVGAGAARLPATLVIILWMPLVTLAAMAADCAAVLILKWLVLGRAKSGQHPFWSCWCGRWDFLYVAWSHWARPVLAQLEGTLLLNAVLRLAGASIGHRVILGHGFAQVVDPDMLTFEDDTTILCHLQAHSFEDRVLKIDRLVVRRGATVGPSAVVFYGADIGAESVVAPHSVVMKHEVLPAGGRYAGNPI